MRVVLAALIVALCALATTAQSAAQEPPVGEFRVVPPSGPIGTVVTVSGDFDMDITKVSFWCALTGFDTAHYLTEPSPSFTFEYEIPSEMLRRQADGTVSPLIGGCQFRAEAGHRLLYMSVPFVATEVSTLPAMGFPTGSRGAPTPTTAVILLAVGGVMLVLMGWRAKAAA